MLTKFLDPKNDVAFKKIFGTEKNKDILIHFLNDMLDFKEKKPIVEVKFLKTIQDPELMAKKTSIVDIMCADEVGNQYIVEMQVADGKDFVKRAQYYAAKAYSSQLKIAEEYNSLKEIIFLAITNFIMFPDKKDFKSDHVILDKLTNEHDLKDFSFTFLELAKFNKAKHELNTIIDKWSFFFKHAPNTKEKDLPEIIGNDSIMQRAYEELNKFGWSEEELFTYESVIKRELDHLAIVAKQREGLEKEHKELAKQWELLEKQCKELAKQQEGLTKQQEGLTKQQERLTKQQERLTKQQEGLTKQYDDIMEKGRIKGAVEGQVMGESRGKIEKAREITKKLFEQNMTIKVISEITGLTIREIEETIN